MKRFTITADHRNKKSSNMYDQYGFQYNKRKEANKSGETLWSCTKRLSTGCKVTVKTLGDFIVAQKNDHTCI